MVAWWFGQRLDFLSLRVKCCNVKAIHFMSFYGKCIAFLLRSNPSRTSWAFCPEQGNRVNSIVANSNSLNHPGDRVRCCILILNLFDYVIDSLLIPLQFNSDEFLSCHDVELKFCRVPSILKMDLLFFCAFSLNNIHLRVFSLFLFFNKMGRLPTINFFFLR